MSAERDVNRIVRSWIRAEEHESADRVLQTVLSKLDTTPQRRSWWPAWRTNQMNTYAKLLGAAAAVLVVAVVGYQLLPGRSGPLSPGGSAALPSAQPSPSISASDGSSVPPGTTTVRPFGPGGFGMCPGADVDPTCVEDRGDDSIAITFEMPSSWDLFGANGPWINNAAFEDQAAVFFYRGNWLYSDPCRPTGDDIPDIPVGPTVDAFVTALVDHPSLEVTAPVDVTLAGYSGKYLELQVPADISECDPYKPIANHIYAQGPGHRWHLWVLDVGGVRVVVETNDYAGTSPQLRAEAQAIVDSIQITP